MESTDGAGTGGFTVLWSGFAIGFEEVMHRAFEGFLGSAGWHEGLEGVKNVSGFGVHRNAIKRGIRSSFQVGTSLECMIMRLGLHFG